jgi:SAM-dependent methyltransferase
LTRYTTRFLDLAETTTGARRILSSPAVFDLWSRAVGRKRAQTILVRDHIRPWPAARVLDLGCGTGELLEDLGDVSYTGVDLSEEYIARARARVGARATFYAGDATVFDLPEVGFDLILAIGVLHHLDDGQVGQLLRKAANALTPNGRMVTVDPTLTSHQSRSAQMVIKRDRGQHVRVPDEYHELARGSFMGVVATVRTDLLRIPYAHCVLEYEAPVAEPI